MNLRARVRWTALGILVGVLLIGVTASPALAEDRGKSGLPHGPGNPIARLQREINALNEQLAQMAQLGQNVTALTQQVAALQQQVTQAAQLGQNVTALTQQVAALQQQVTQATQLGQNVTALTQQVVALQQQVTALATLQQQVTGLNGQVAGLNGQVVSLSGQVAGLNSQIVDLNTRLQSNGASNSLAVYDAHDTKIGDVVGVQDEIPWVSLTAGGQVVALQVFSQHLVGGFVWFTGANCSGTPYVADSAAVFSGADVFSMAAVRDPGGEIYAAPPTTATQLVQVQSVAQHDGTCFTFPSPTTNMLVPATKVMTLDLQFSRPYKVH